MSWEHGGLQKKIDELKDQIEVYNLLGKIVVSRVTQKDIEFLMNKRSEVIGELHTIEGQIIDMKRHLKGAREEWHERLLEVQEMIAGLESARDNDIALLSDNAIPRM